MALILQQKVAKEQTSPIAKKLREDRTTVRPISQVNLRLKAIPGVDRFTETIKCVLPWMNTRAGRKLPPAAWEHKSFELSEIGSQRTAAISIESPRFWSGRLDDACKEVPLRTWITEIGVGVHESSGDILFGARLICATRGAEAPTECSIPSFVKAVVAAGPTDLDGVLLQAAPRFLTSESDIANLVDLLERPNRHGDVVVFSLPDVIV